MDDRDPLLELAPLRVHLGEDGEPAVFARWTSLGALLIERGLASPQQVNDALAESTRTGERVGEVMVRRGWASEEDVARMLSVQSGFPFRELGSLSVEPSARDTLPSAEARRLEACVIDFDGEIPIVVVADPTAARISSVQERLGDETHFTIVTAGTLAELLESAQVDEPDEPSSMVTDPDPPEEIAGEAPTAVRDAPDTAGDSELPTLQVDQGVLESEFDSLTATLHASVEALNLLRARVEHLVELSAESIRELDDCRRQLREQESAREHDRAAVSQLETQLAQEETVRTELKRKLGDVMSGLDAAGDT